MGGITALCWKAPGLASSLMSGAPNLGIDHVHAPIANATKLAVPAIQSLLTSNPAPALAAATRVASSAGSSASSVAGVASTIPAASANLVRSLA
jgi:hypothetical protein